MRHILAVLDDSDSFVHNDGGDDENLVTRRQIFDLNLNKTITITMTIAIATKPRQQMEDLSSWFRQLWAPRHDCKEGHAGPQPPT